jgi:hypothetical protein
VTGRKTNPRATAFLTQRQEGLAVRAASPASAHAFSFFITAAALLRKKPVSLPIARKR